MSDDRKGYLWPTMLTLLAVAIVTGGAFWLSQSSLLAIESIEINGNQAISDDQVMEVIGPRLYGQSLLKYSFNEVGDALREMPFVEYVEIKRIFPHTIRIDIREYHPSASYAGEDGTFFLLSGDGRVLSTAAEPDAALPLLQTDEACAADVGNNLDCGDIAAGLQFITSVPLNLNQDFNLVEVSSGAIVASTAGGIEVHFGTMDEYAYKFEVLRQLIARSIAAGEQVIIDVSVPDRPVLRAKAQPQPEESVAEDIADDDGAVADEIEGLPMGETEEPLVDEGYQLEVGQEAWVE